MWLIPIKTALKIKNENFLKIIKEPCGTPLLLNSFISFFFGVNEKSIWKYASQSGVCGAVSGDDLALVCNYAGGSAVAA